MDSCVFCKIVKNELPAYKVWEDSKHLAFLTIFPIKDGHVLVIPKAHTDYYFDLDDQSLADLNIAAKKVSQMLVKAFNPETNKVGVIVAGIQVPHAHVHLIPLDDEEELSFAKAHSESKENLQKVLDKIKSA